MTTVAKMRLALVDDHTLFRKGLLSLINMAASDSEILFEADSGIDLQKKLDARNLPDIILMDVSMPGMDGIATVGWLNANFPDVKVLALSMIEKEETIVKLLRLGVRGYLCKDVEPRELGDALRSIMQKGYYYSDFLTGKLLHSIRKDNYNDGSAPQVELSENEKVFLRMACTELTYNEIAAKMFLSPKTIDGYRHALFEKLAVKSRVGLVLYAIRNGLVEI